MLNIFLQREQESSRSDAVTFRGKGWSRLTPWGGTWWSVPLTATLSKDATPSKDESEQLRGKRVEG